MKNAAVIWLLGLSAGLFAQVAIPVGTILPVQLNSSLRSDKARPGQLIRARVMQDIPLPGHTRIHAGATVMGQVVAVRPASNGSSAEISIRFDTLATGTQHIPVITNLRALATMMDVAEAQIPESGPDRGTSEYSWTRTRSEARSTIVEAVPLFTQQRLLAILCPTACWFASVLSRARNAVGRSMETTGLKRCGFSLPMPVVFTIFPTLLWRMRVGLLRLARSRCSRIRVT
jgi:hypothetical protein